MLDMNAFAEMFDAHAAYLFDYCSSFVGAAVEPASATELALVTAAQALEAASDMEPAVATAAQSVLHDQERMRAWLFALARQECLSNISDVASGPDYVPATLHREDEPDAKVADPGLDDLAGQLEEVLPAFMMLLGREREVLDLVYRHGIRPDDLPAVLGVPADRAGALLAAAEAEFDRSADVLPDAERALGSKADVGSSALERLVDLPLATLPDSVWRRTARAFDAAEPQFLRQTSDTQLAATEPAGERRRLAAWRTPARQRLSLAAMLLVPVATIVAVAVYFLGPSRDLGNHQGAAISRPTASADPPSTTANGPSPLPGSSSAHAHHKAPKHSALPVGPAPSANPAPSKSPKPKPKPKPDPSPTTKISSPPPFPTPTPTPTPDPSPSPTVTSTP
jgi:DNA-directed RNA polymerase specialized sigma24 family protein